MHRVSWVHHRGVHSPLTLRMHCPPEEREGPYRAHLRECSPDARRAVLVRDCARAELQPIAHVPHRGGVPPRCETELPWPVRSSRGHMHAVLMADCAHAAAWRAANVLKESSRRWVARWVQTSAHAERTWQSTSRYHVEGDQLAPSGHRPTRPDYSSSRRHITAGLRNAVAWTPDVTRTPPRGNSLDGLTVQHPSHQGL
jgi:hypothetical protein